MYFEDAVDQVLADVKAVLVSHNKKYGPNNISDFGEMGIVIRLNDKLHRLKQWYFEADNRARENTPDESLNDTWTDIEGYAAIAMMVRHDIWGLPMKPEE